MSPRRRTAGRLALAVAAVGLAAFAVTRTTLAAPPDRPAMWKKVAEAEAKGLPQTAIKELEPIIASALADKAYPEAVKAVAKKIALEANVQGNKPEERITRMKAEIDKAPAEVRPVMHAVLAHWYWHYFQQNNWRFVRRTATAAPPGNDFTTWDLPRLFAEIDAEFTAALAAEKDLKATPVSAYAALLDKGTVPDSYRPTLWDFVANDALTFYQSPEQAGAQPDDAFAPDAGGPVLAPADEFLKWNPQTTDTASRKLKAVKLYQNLLGFHRDDADPSAYLDADLSRLKFAHAASVGEERTGRYKAALQQYFEAHAGHELSARARFLLATVLDGENEKVEAKKVAEAGMKAFPDSPGGKMCYNLVRQIEAPSLEVRTERVWADPLPPVRVKYRNLTTLHFRAYKADWLARLGTARWRPEQLDHNELLALLAKKPDAAWTADLPGTPDYLPRTEDLPARKDLPPGFYHLVASPDADFRQNGRPVFLTDVWVSDLALVVRNGLAGGEIDGLVLKANAGTPVAGAKVRGWTRDNQGRFNPAAGPVSETDANGRFRIAGPPNTSWVVLAAAGDQALAAGNDHYIQNVGTPRAYGQTVLFTDRAIYRPGQTVRFKGIALSVDPVADRYEAQPNQRVHVRFADPNGKEIAALDLGTNEYGSFDGSFTAPRDRLTGRMTISVTTNNLRGQTQVSVEEYKRPQFLTELDAPKDPAKLNEAVTLTGRATAYTGAAIGGAKVAYRVAREVRYPGWWHEFYWWRVPPTPVPAQEVAHGTAATGPDGTFTVTFPAKPDRTVAEKDEPIFSYTVTADVTDANGETRTATRTVKVGYTALAATVSADPWQTADAKVKLTVTTKTHDGEGQAAKGKVTVYALKQPETPVRPDILGREPAFPRPRGKGGIAPGNDPKPDPSDPKAWEQADAVATVEFATDPSGTTTVPVSLPAGPFRAVVETQDKYGKKVTARTQVTVIDPAAKALAVKVPNLLASPAWTVEPGKEFTAVWGTGYGEGRAYVEVEHRGKVLQAYWTDPGRTQATVTQKVEEKMRGGFTVRVTYVRENRAYLEARHVDVPWTNKNLTVKWERFVSKLEPGQKETYTAVVTGPDAKRAVAEMVATLYDASLDAFQPLNWMTRFGVFRQDHSYRHVTFENGPRYLYHVVGTWPPDVKPVGPITYRAFPPDVTVNVWGYAWFGRGGGKGGIMPMSAAAPGMANRSRGLEAENAALGMNMLADGADEQRALRKSVEAGKDAAEKQFAGEDKADRRAGPAGGPDLSQVAARSNLAETAFFFPHLVSDSDGVVRMEFTMPEALTKWKFLGFAHDKELRSGLLTGETVTAKDLMVQPNAPRFLREGDVIEFVAKVTNQSAGRQAGTARLTLTDARTGQEINAAMGNATPDLGFDVPSKEARVVSWRLTVPDGQGPVIYKVVGASDRLSDGEEGMIPVLSKRVYVTESLPLPIRGNQTRKFEFEKLLASGRSDTLKSQALTVQVTSNPAWYAVLALPYLMEFPHECTEQTFNRLYANALARHVAASDPKIRRVFDQWKNTPALNSPLEKNQDLKSVILDETPWVRDAQNESQARRNVGVLFDETRLTDETARTLKKLADMQQADGAWPWFPGGPPNDYVTLYIATGFGRLRHLGAKADVAPAVKAMARLDQWVTDWHNRIVKKDENHLTPAIALYLYGRSFFLKDVPVAPPHQAAVAYWQGQAKKYWLQLANRQSQAHLAVGLKRFGDPETPRAIMASVRERAVTDDEMGMFWRDTELNLWWYRAPIETQAMMIEAFDEVAGDAKAVEECKVWLLKQKQTRDWKTTKATADAVYGLLLRGSDLLESDALVEVSLAGEQVKPAAAEVGTGYYEEKFVRAEVKPDMGHVEVKNPNPGVAWGSVHWQYLEDISKVTPHAGTPLKVEKKLFRKVYTKAGPTLVAVTGSVQVGDEIVVRVVLRTDRDMEYVHLKDHRGSGTEPVNVLSKYKYQDGLAYYEATRDTSTDFFIDYLPKGTYVFEYPVRVQLRGKYPTGMANAQCMYAPEFNSHSESIPLEAK